MLGISTACMPGLASNLEEFFKFATDIGFRAFEMGISSVETTKEDILDWQKRQKPKVVSVHNLFADKAVDPENRRGDFLASPDEEKRRETVEATLKTAEFARELGARAVILHAGYIEEKGLRKSYRDFRERWCRRKESRHLKAWREHLCERRDGYAYDYVGRVVRSLRTLCQRDSETMFCLEPRVNLYEIPNLREMEEIFDRVKEDNLRYWHDTGHCQVQENLGLSRQEDWLKAFGKKMVGIHLHDVRWLGDHLTPGVGDVDFSLVKKYLPEETIKVVEVGDNVSAEELRKGVNFLERRGIF